MYTVDDLVKIAKREKNKKRSYLFVNPLQGKHIPADPVKVDNLCACLAKIIDDEFKENKKYVVGFAETATGVSAAVCQHMSNVVFFEHTTREYSRKKEYIFFTESHSHAKEQLLDKSGLETAVEKAEIIVLIDDEITTGNTVCKLIDQLKENYEYKGLFIIASLVNSMTDDRIEELKEQGIECRYVLRIPHEYKAELAEILTIFSREYIVSGPVWEFFSSDNNEWKDGLMREVARDRLNGFVGKTVIHPKQIEIVNQAFKVSRKDYEDAKTILNWDETVGLQVGKSSGGERMNEVKTHGNWALKTIMLAQIYGIS